MSIEVVDEIPKKAISHSREEKYSLLNEEVKYEKYSNLFDDFLASSLSEETRKAYINDLRKFAKYLAVKQIRFIPHQFSPKNMADFRKYLEEELNQSDATIKRCLSSLKTFWDFLIEMGELKLNPVSAIRKPRVTLEVKTQELTNEEVLQLFNGIKLNNSDGSKRLTGYLEKAILEVMFYTGLRKSEVVRIKLDELITNEEDCFVRVKTKGGVGHDVHLSKNVMKAINDYLKIRPNPHESDYLFLGSKRHTPLTPRSINKLFLRVAKEAGIKKKITPHSSRVTVAGNLYDQGASLVDQATYLRHSDQRMTIEYNKRRKDNIKKTGALINYKN